MQAKNYYGIDFGTTSCAVVEYRVTDDDLDKFLFGTEGRPEPSVVAIDRKTGDIYTGLDAWKRRAELSQTCEYISSIKSILDSEQRWEIAGKIWTAVEIAAELFKMLKRRVSQNPGSDLKDATVAIPIGFSPEKRKKLREAAKIAGITITSFVSEPTAAFFANYKNLRATSNVCVFDWGGGTLDVSVLKIEKDKIFELATKGMDVAGDKIDQKIAERIHNQFARRKNFASTFHDMPSVDQDKMRVSSENAKRSLSDDDDATISIAVYGDLGTCRENIGYDWFVDIISPEVDQAMQVLQEAIDDSKVGLANIDAILMIGGSSNLRPLLERMEEKYGEKMVFPDQTMWNIAEGAANLAMTPGVHYSSQSFGLTLSDGSYFELLKPNQQLEDWGHTCHFGIVDTTQNARIIFSGSSDLNESTNRFWSFDVPSYSFLQERIELKALVDQNMVLNVIARSNMRPEEFQRVWKYPELKFCYVLPESKGAS